MNYTYAELHEGERQYDICDFEQKGFVEAVYVKSRIEADNGNPYIEALPEPRNSDEVFAAYNKGVIGYRRDEQLKWNDYDKLSSITLLRKVRYMLPFHLLLEEEFSMALKVSYRDRVQRKNVMGDLKIVHNGSEEDIGARLIGKNGAAANAGVTVLGYSGCGKSASLEILLSNYPQIIEHKSETMIRFTQIVYLVVVCPANSNFSALYSSIGAEIDSVLGNVEPVYESMVRRCRTVGEKANMLCKLIELFGIGCIIFDEIQLMDFDGQKESTFESLLTIVNKTKVAIMAVGTQDAYKKMFPNLRTSRRTGAFIEANQYCKDTRYFAAIVTNLMQYQWFDEYVNPDSSLIRALYDVTKGIIDQLISIYIYMQIDYIRADKKPEINADYVYKISETYYPGIKKLLNDLDNPANEMQHQSIVEEGKANIQRILEKAKVEESKEKFLRNINSQDNQRKMTVKENAIRNIQNTIKITGDVYNLSRIEKAVEHVLGLKKNEGADEELVTQEAYQWLKKNKSDKRAGGKKKAKMDEEHIAVRNLLLEE